MRRRSTAAATTLVAASLAWTTLPGAATSTRVPLTCSKGPSGQHYDGAVTVPASTPEGSTITVRVDGTPSGRISHTGLNYIHDMTTELVVPGGSTYVAGSGRIVPDTGTDNVRAGARVTQQGATIAMTLPARVEDGGSYTPPSFEFQLKVTASGGSTIVQKFSQYRVTANAFIIGDVHTVCDPTPKPYTVASTIVTFAPSPTP